MYCRINDGKPSSPELNITSWVIHKIHHIRMFTCEYGLLVFKGSIIKCSWTQKQCWTYPHTGASVSTFRVGTRSANSLCYPRVLAAQQDPHTLLSRWPLCRDTFRLLVDLTVPSGAGAGGGGGIRELWGAAHSSAATPGAAPHFVGLAEPRFKWRVPFFPLPPVRWNASL